MLVRILIIVTFSVACFGCSPRKASPPPPPVGVELGAVVNEEFKVTSSNAALITELRRLGQEAYETDRGVVINLPDVLFEYDKADLKEDARRALGDIAVVIKTVPERRVSVEGHTDAKGTVAYNQQLSEARARSVTRELIANGIPRKQILTLGLGEAVPVASNNRESGQIRNRRVEVVLEN
jgi:outer membrane protein OmpA-like peptidoglycan-associated protein